MKKKLLAGLTTGLFLTAMAGMANADLIVNGSFESPELNTKSFSIFNTIDGWETVSGSGIEIQNSVAGSSFDGEQHAELDSRSNSTMKQLVDTVEDLNYTLSFWYSPRPGVAAGSNGINVYWDDVQLGATITGTTTGNTAWTQYTFSVFGKGYDTVLAFSAEGTSDSYGGYLDAVSLSPAPVPEPATMLLFGAGLAGLAGARLRRKKK